MGGERLKIGVTVGRKKTTPIALDVFDSSVINVTQGAEVEAMYSGDLKPDLEGLQQDVITRLKEISGLMMIASEILGEGSLRKKYTEFKQKVDTAKQQVENLELVMSIIAPMKAGKSTAINAIVGRELLPSRSDAMTTLPTEVVFKAELEQPILKLSQSVVSVFSKTIAALQSNLQELDTDQMKRIRAKYGHLNYLFKLFEKIPNQSSPSLVLEQETPGFNDIRETLTALNDIIRLCSLIDGVEDPIGELLGLESPRIETPFWQQEDAQETAKVGNLVIIDTPGSNEAGQEQRLETVIRKQIEKSAVVLIMLNFGRIGATDNDKVKIEVENVRKLQGRGKDNLYVLVNQIDRRGKGSRTPEEVKEFVKEAYGIGNSGDNKDTNRVFEISAHWALFSANFFLRGLDENEDAAKNDIKIRPDIARDLLGAEWEEDLENASLEELERKVKRLRKRSGFDEFIKKAIEDLMLFAAPKSMKEALQESGSYLGEVTTDVAFTRNAIDKNLEEIQSQKDALQSKIDSIDDCHNRLQIQINQKQEKLNNKLEGLIIPLKEAARVTSNDYFSNDRKKALKKWIELVRKQDVAQEIVNKIIDEFISFEAWIKQKSSLQFNWKEVNGNNDYSVEFSSKADAEEFAKLALYYATGRTEKLFDSIRNATKQELEKSLQELRALLDSETKPIIEEAKEQLSKAFKDADIPEKPPVPEPDIDLDFIQIPQVNDSPQFKDVYEFDRPFYFIWKVIQYLFMIRKTIKTPKKIGETYTVSLEELIFYINQLIDENIDRIYQGSKQYIIEQFEKDTCKRNHARSIRAAVASRTHAEWCHRDGG
ncbi:dynamin family protein, partial [Moorena sp. SIO4G3]|uniref:dynamin family protein n=1 Tax=Moorena sp. SIO4G3 TaxID=2607821 RepID=UPI00142B5F4E|nr:hypothetical protein [Moorena sp. SIO4G3]